MNDVSCRSELVLRERRGELSAAERAAFSAHLAACEACRESERLGRDFDQCAELERGDGERILALSELARGWASEKIGGSPEQPANAMAARQASRRAWRKRTLLVAAALPLFVAAVASAAYGVYRARHPEPAGENASAAVAAAARAPARRASPPVGEAAPAPVTAAPESTPVPAAAPAIRARAAAPARASATLAERFEQANQARRGGDIARAITLYRDLERDFPASAEAAAAELRLGSLLLDRGSAGAALEQFNRHLRRPGALVPEALYGRGRALAALDESGAERQIWTRMLREYSGSPYAAHARRRLETLDRPGPASEN